MSTYIKYGTLIIWNNGCERIYVTYKIMCQSSNTAVLCSYMGHFIIFTLCTEASYIHVHMWHEASLWHIFVCHIICLYILNIKLFIVFIDIFI